MKAFDKSEFEAYGAEVKERWGDTFAYAEHVEKTGDYSKEKWGSLAADMDAIFAEFSRCMENGAAAGEGEAQALVKKLQAHITENYYGCTDEILAGLGQLYTADERFRNNIDRHACGTAAFVSEAIRIYCRKN